LSWNQRDDISTALFFHVNSFPGIKDEHAALDEMVQTLSPSGQRQSITVPFDYDNKRQERALHRLKILGVVSDYLKEYGSQQFDVTTETSDSAAVKRNLVDFVERTQPGRVQEMSSRVGAINLGHHETVSRCARLLIDFVYETVERSRRRSLREMLLAARQGKTDRELRERVLNYLSEGDVGRVIESLVESTKVDLDVWISHWNEIVSRTDASEWRASAARLLTSFPDHPGLLLTRALGEILDTEDGPIKSESVEEYASNLESALQTAGPLYRLSTGDISRTIDWLARRVSKRSEIAGGLTISIAERYDVVSRELFNWLSELAKENVGAAIIDLDRNLIEAFHLVDTVLKKAQGES
jgi:ATP-dependent DNA helicase RecQ